MPNIVPNEDDDVSAQISRSFRKMGMKVMTSASVEKVDIEGDVCHVTIQTKKGLEVVDCDIVLSAVGVITNLENIGLEEVGIQVERTKIVVDDYYRTNVEGYYAIGDVVHGPALAHVASTEALVCVEKNSRRKSNTGKLQEYSGLYIHHSRNSIGRYDRKSC